MTTELDGLLKRLHLANARRLWNEIVRRAEEERWSYETFLRTLVEEEVAHRKGTRLLSGFVSQTLRSCDPTVRLIE